MSKDKSCFLSLLAKQNMILSMLMNWIEQISKAVTQTDVTGIINCCSGNPMTLAERVENFIKDHKLKIRLNYGVFPDRPYDSPIIFGDDKKIKQIMSLK